MSQQTIGHPGYTGNFLGVDLTNKFCIAITSPNTKLQSNFDYYTRITDEVWGHLVDESNP